MPPHFRAVGILRCAQDDKEPTAEGGCATCSGCKTRKALCLGGRWGLRRRQLGWLGLYGLHLHLLRWDEDRVHGVSFHTRRKFYKSLVAEFADEAVEDVASQVAVRHLASLEAQAGLDLVTLIEEADGVVLLGLEIVLVHVDAELDL